MGASPLPPAPAPEAVTWHLRRRRAILNAHPGVRELFGPEASPPVPLVWGARRS
jgi:hypothetical protein